MIFNIYVSNKIGSEAVGVFSLVMSVYLFAVTIATSGLTLACTCIVSEQFAKGNFFDGLKAVKTCLIFSIFLGITTSILVIIFSDIIAENWLNSMISTIPIYLISVGLPFIAISSVINGYFSAVRKGYKSAIAQVFEVVIKIIVSIILLALNLSKGVESICTSLILADVISEIFSCTLLFVFYKIDKIKYCKRKVEKVTFKKRIFQITFPVSITSYIRSGLSTLKQFIIPARLVLFGYPYSMALSEYGKINGMALSVIMFPNVFIISFSNLLIPEFSSLLANKNKKRIVDICHKIFTITSIFSICISGIFICFANEISLMVFQNLECSNYIRILSPLILFMYIDNIIDSMLKGLNKQFGVMICNILDLVITICALYFLLPLLGIPGFIIAIFISEIFNFCVSYFQLYKTINFKIDVLNSILKPIICAFISFVMINVIQINTNSFNFEVILKILVFIIFYTIMIILLNHNSVKSTL